MAVKCLLNKTPRQFNSHLLELVAIVIVINVVIGGFRSDNFAD